MTPKLIIHGGAGSQEGEMFTAKQYELSLLKIIKKVFAVLKRNGARAAVCGGICLLEDDPIFNAGTGSKLQADGQVRMTAALMSAKDNRFSGVINIKNVKNPIVVADLLAHEEFNVLGGTEATEYARLKSIPFYNPVTEERQREYKKALAGQSGTVGIVAMDADGHICAGTSTGGVGLELAGRISDSGTVAGTYASQTAGVSCTGRGEHIVNQAAAARVVTRVEDGMPLKEAVDKLIKEGDSRRYRFGLIALDCHGEMVVGHTRNINVLYACHDGKKIMTFKGGS